MFNKTDAAKSSEAQKRESIISPPEITDTVVRLPKVPVKKETVPKSPLNRAVAKFARLSLNTKATILAIAIGTLPVLGIGALTFQLASQSIFNKIAQAQEAEAVSLADKINRFMFERYGDIQVLSSLPILTNSRIKAATTSPEKQQQLDKFIETYKIYDYIAVFDRDGNLIVQSTGEAVQNPKNQPYFQTALKEDRPVISQPISRNIYAAAPVKDSATNQTIGVAIAQMPLKNLDELARANKSSDVNYHLIDASGRYFLASEPEHIGQKVQDDLPIYNNLHTGQKVVAQSVFDEHTNSNQFISFTPTRQIQGMPNLNWEVLLATDAGSALAPQRQLFWTIAIGTGLTALIVAAIAAWVAKRATEPILKATTAVSKLGQGDFNSRVDVEGEDELGILSANINQMALQLETLVKEQEQDAERAKLLADITLRIRRTLRLEEIYKTAVREVRQALRTDRVIIYEFNSEVWDGSVVAESVSAGFPKMQGVHIDDPCFRERHVDTYKDGRVRAINNIYQEPTLTNAHCYTNMLEKFAVKANLIAPIVSQEQLIGLMIAHNCDSPRVWLQPEIDLFKQLATQVGYAIEQARLLEEIEKARNVAEKSTEEERHQKEALQMQLLELLSDVEGAASGDLTVRADVTAGEIGTVADFFNSIVESLRDIVTQVKDTASKVNDAIGANSGAIRELAEEAMEQATEINLTLDAVDRMTYSIQSVAESAQQAAAIAQNASITATKGGKAMDMTVQNILHLRETVGETAKKVKRLGESTQQISRVVALINQISMQTNLLAINAGIEAARAGEEGQGFAVVAEEVGELAARSAAATKEIEQIVENIQRETSEVVQAMEVGTTQVVEGTRIVEDAKHSLSQILDVSQQIDFLVQSISKATTSGVETSQIVSDLMKQIAAVSQRTSESSRQVSESLQQTVNISQQLQETVGTFKVN